MKPGKYRAFPESWGVGETKSGKPEVYIEFRNTEGETVTWRGYFNEGFTREKTIETLVTCGFRDEDVIWLSEQDALDKTNPVQIVVDEEEYNGKMYAKVNWVNSFRNSPDKAKAKEIFKGLDLRALFKEKMKAGGASTRKRPAFTPAEVEDVIPF